MIVFYESGKYLISLQKTAFRDSQVLGENIRKIKIRERRGGAGIIHWESSILFRSVQITQHNTNCFNRN